jgi:protein-tyrosine phosphatase
MDSDAPTARAGLDRPARRAGACSVAAVIPSARGTASDSDAPRARRIALGAVINFRDLGGYETVTGGTTRWRSVFRSDSLSKITPADRVAFEELGIKAVLDLRSSEERELKPTVAGSRHMPFTSRPPLVDARTLRTREEAENWLAAEYPYMLEHAGPDIGRLFGWLADEDHLPAVFHCAGGKDRTGLATALLLTLLGVERETVLDDYELTSQFAGERDLAPVIETFCSSGMSRAAAEGLLSTPRWAMASALDQLDERYGGVEAYLLGDAGMSHGDLAALRQHLTVFP